MTNNQKAQAIFEAYTGIKFDEERLIHIYVVEDMEKFLSNQADNLGLSSITINGITESYMSNFPSYVLKTLDSLKKRVKVM